MQPSRPPYLYYWHSRTWVVQSSIYILRLFGCFAWLCADISLTSEGRTSTKLLETDQWENSHKNAIILDLLIYSQPAFILTILAVFCDNGQHDQETKLSCYPWYWLQQHPVGELRVLHLQTSEIWYPDGLPHCLVAALSETIPDTGYYTIMSRRREASNHASWFHICQSGLTD